MGLIKKDTFICLDCETTGLELNKDRIIEVAAARFTYDGIIDSFETLIDPQCPIPQISIDIHHITDEMVKGKPKIAEILPDLLRFLNGHIIIGHGIKFDLTFLTAAAKQYAIPCSLLSQTSIDTLRMARLYGESPKNSLETLRGHFNIVAEGAHRAMNDVIVNIEVFKFLAAQFTETEKLLERLTRPILLKTMPLGKHKGRPFSEVPLEYLMWASHKDFDQDLLFSIRSEIKKRKKGNLFEQATNPFANL